MFLMLFLKDSSADHSQFQKAWLLLHHKNFTRNPRMARKLKENILNMNKHENLHSVIMKIVILKRYVRVLYKKNYQFYKFPH